MLDKYSIRYKYYASVFTYSRQTGRKHEEARTVEQPGFRREFVENTRYKVVVTDYEDAVRAIELLKKPRKAKAVFARHVDIVRDVFLNLPSISRRVLVYFYPRTLRRVFHLNYYEKTKFEKEYRLFAKKQVVRRLMPNWRGMRYVQLMIYKPRELGIS